MPYPARGPRGLSFSPIYTGLFVVLLVGWPIVPVIALVPGAAHPAGAWTLAVSLVAAWLLLLYYVQHRCSTPQLSYWRALRFVTACMSTGWLYMSLLLIIPALALAFVASLGCALASDVRGVPGQAPIWFHQFLRVTYQNRARPW